MEEPACWECGRNKDYCQYPIPVERFERSPFPPVSLSGDSVGSVNFVLQREGLEQVSYSGKKDVSFKLTFLQTGWVSFR
jgi:hypothetical protein